MRRLFQYLAIIATLIALNGCNGTGPIPPSFELASLQDGVTLHCRIYNEYVPKQAVLHAQMGVYSTYNLDEWANKTSHIRQKMKEVIKEISLLILIVSSDNTSYTTETDVRTSFCLVFVCTSTAL